MKKFIVILILILPSLSFCQIIEGMLIDSERKEPIAYANVSTVNSAKGTQTDSIGRFKISIQENDTLMITYIGRSVIQIINLPSNKNNLNIGKLELLNKASSLYVTSVKKRFLSKKTKLVCKLIDNVKKLKEKDLIVKCPDRKISYKWELLDNGFLQLDYSKLKKCEIVK